MRNKSANTCPLVGLGQARVKCVVLLCWSVAPLKAEPRLQRSSTAKEKIFSVFGAQKKDLTSL